ncbi:MAG: 16S rRNA processing protein RimM [Desulfobacterales bacterium C00003104]|nr:MAG: 16S rRNA processing protein RimM [Desulfobacterales bacterium C00003104]
MGKITGPHGLRGEAKLVSYAESIDLFLPGTRLFLTHRDGRQCEYTIESARPHKKGVLLKLRGIDSIDEINLWRNAEVLCEKACLRRLDDGTYYWFQIIGLNVLTVDHRSLGKVASIIRTGSNDVYVVRNESNEALIPALDSVIVEIDLEKKLMLVDWP